MPIKPVPNAMSSVPPTAQPGCPMADYDQHARTCAPAAIWTQAKRTVRGEAVSEAHIGMIVEAIKQRLALDRRDVVLDLACGNGALSQRLYDSCAALLGVDISEYLISIANDRFADAPRFAYVADGAAQYLRAEANPDRFTKVLCYGSFAYFSQDDAEETLALLHNKFVNVETVFIGNLPDREHAAAFFAHRTPEPNELADPRAQIGIWRSQAEFAAMAESAGWAIEFSTMPDGFFSVHYRYDALLRRKPGAAR